MCTHVSSSIKEPILWLRLLSILSGWFFCRLFIVFPASIVKQMVFSLIFVCGFVAPFWGSYDNLINDCRIYGWLTSNVHLLWWLCLFMFLCPGIVKKSRKRGKNQESIQSSTTPDPGHQWKSNKLTIRHHKREPRGQLFPIRWPQGKRRIFEVNCSWRLPWAAMGPLAKRSADRSMAACF